MGVPFAISKSFSSMAYSPAVPVSESPLPLPVEPPLPSFESPLPPPFESPLPLPVEPPLPPFDSPGQPRLLLPPVEPPSFTPFPEPGPNCHVYV